MLGPLEFNLLRPRLETSGSIRPFSWAMSLFLTPKPYTLNLGYPRVHVATNKMITLTARDGLQEG